MPDHSVFCPKHLDSTVLVIHTSFNSGALYIYLDLS